MTFCLFIFILILSTNANPIKSCTFQKLYKSTEERFVIFQALNNLFLDRFEKLLKEVSHETPYLVDPALHFQNDIRDKYINEGYQLKSIEDLEVVLKELNYIKFKDFREQKLKYDKTGRLV